MASRKKDPEERKAEILQAALRLFTENGYEATRVSDIVSAVGVSQGAFYWYFDSKEAILDAVAEDYALRVYDELEAVLTNKRLDAVAKLERFFKIMNKSALEAGQLVNEISTTKPRQVHSKMAQRLASGQMELVKKVIQQGIDEGQFDTRDPEAAALLIILPGVFLAIEEGARLLAEMGPTRYMKAYREMTYRILGYRATG